MNEDSQNLSPRTSGPARTSLAERLDPALGEASAGIGVLLTELMRRTLRGGVSKIEEEIDDLVDEKVGMNVAKRMPEFEQAATRTAEEKARTVAGEAVEGVRQEANASAERLTKQIDDTRSHAEQSIQSTAEQLTSNITESESRAEEKARNLVSDHIADLAKKSQKTYQAVQDKLGTLDEHTLALERQLKDEEQARQAALQQLESALQQQSTASRQQLDDMRRQLTDELDERDRRITRLMEVNQQLADRLAELERPKGMKAVWNKVFGRKPKEAPPALEFEESHEPELLDREDEPPRD